MGEVLQNRALKITKMLNKPKANLSDLFILDFTGMISGAFCTKLLADLGANVLKIEPPGGEIMRNVAPLVDDKSCVFGSLNIGKKSITLDLKTDESVDICLKLIKKYDIVIENFSPGVMQRLGLDYEAMRVSNENVIMCSISGYGQSGPDAYQPAFAPIVQAKSGYDLTYTEAQDNCNIPLNMGPPVGDTTASLIAYGSILAAVHYRNRTGIGQYIDIAMQDALLSTMHRDIQTSITQKKVDRRYGPIRASDGFVVIMPFTQIQFEKLLKCIEREELINDIRFAEPKRRLENYNKLMEIVEEWTKNRTSLSVDAQMKKLKIPSTRYARLEQITTDPQIEYRKFLIQAQDQSEQYQVCGNPSKFSETETCINRLVPGIGEHNSEILDALKNNQGES